mmetsp:Transcript_15005/g.32134  ORF Transcript_15005/g.32134 Transcript_15005/m.32134 type:complete len:402 (-) Transcript_15005:156-1361(-)
MVRLTSPVQTLATKKATIPFRLTALKVGGTMDGVVCVCCDSSVVVVVVVVVVAAIVVVVVRMHHFSSLWHPHRDVALCASAQIQKTRLVDRRETGTGTGSNTGPPAPSATRTYQIIHSAMARPPSDRLPSPPLPKTNRLPIHSPTVCKKTYPMHPRIPSRLARKKSNHKSASAECSLLLPILFVLFLVDLGAVSMNRCSCSCRDDSSHWYSTMTTIGAQAIACLTNSGSADVDVECCCLLVLVSSLSFLGSVSSCSVSISIVVSVTVLASNNCFLRVGTIAKTPSVKKKFQCTPYSVTCSWYSSSLVVTVRTIPMIRRGAALTSGLKKERMDGDDVDVGALLLLLSLLLLLPYQPFPLTIPPITQKEAAPTSIKPYPLISVLQKRLGKTLKSTARMPTKVR